MYKRIIAISLLLLPISLSGCSEEKKKPSPVVTPSELDLVSWWKSPGEREALDVLLAAFEAATPGASVLLDADILNGTNAVEDIKARLRAGDPPDAFQVSPRNLIEFTELDLTPDDTDDTKTNVLLPLSELYAQEGWTAVFPEEFLAAVSYPRGSAEASYYAVPLNVHRYSCMYYKSDLVLDPAQQLADAASFVTFAQAVSAAGGDVIPLAIACKPDCSSVKYSLYGIMAQLAGRGFYERYFKKQLDLSSTTTDDYVSFVRVLDAYDEVLKYTNANPNLVSEDSANFVLNTTWSDAANLLVNGAAATIVNGDWAKGYLTSVGETPGIDFAMIPAFGIMTAKVFTYGLDGFAVPASAPNLENALEFLRVLTDPAVQVAFSAQKGSVPASTAAELVDLDVVSRVTAQDLADVIAAGEDGWLHNAELYRISNETRAHTDYITCNIALAGEAFDKAANGACRQALLCFYGLVDAGCN